MPVDGTVNNGTIDYPGDYDYFTFSALPDHLYSVQVRPLADVNPWYLATVLLVYWVNRRVWGAGRLPCACSRIRRNK